MSRCRCLHIRRLVWGSTRELRTKATGMMPTTASRIESLRQRSRRGRRGDGGDGGDVGDSDPLETLDRQDEDGRPADLDLERVGHEELARLHDRWHRVHHLRPGVAGVADDPEDRINLIILDPEDDRRVRLLQEAARAVQSGGPSIGADTCVSGRPREGLAGPTVARCTMRQAPDSPVTVRPRSPSQETRSCPTPTASDQVP